MRIKEQETCLTLQEHDDDDDDLKVTHAFHLESKPRVSGNRVLRVDQQDGANSQVIRSAMLLPGVSSSISYFF